MVHTAELIAVGTELLLGNIANTDAQAVSETLSTLGINVYYHTVVGDNPRRLKEVLEIAKKRADLIITTGGLGPTYDDLTKQTVCETFGKPLVLRPELVDWLHRVYERQLHRPMPENNLRQAMFPADCTIFDNPVGTAPGCAIEADGVRVLLLPGPPHECRYMLEHYAVPYLRSLSDEVIVSHDLRVFGIGESRIEEMLYEPMTTLRNPTLAPYAKFSECMLRCTAKAKTEAEAEEMLQPLLRQVKETLGDAVYGQDVSCLEEVVMGLLREKDATLSTAESCTGGLIAKRMTDLPGASAVFRGGVVSYVNAVKADVLGVPQALLEQYGAVSAPVAKAMAEGARAICGSDYALSVTGVAGPERDERDNAVGMVFIGLAGPEGTLVREYALGQRRDRVRASAANHALDLLRRRLSGLELK